MTQDCAECRAGRPVCPGLVCGRDGGHAHPGPDRPLCGPCRRQTGRVLAELPETYVHLYLALPRSSGGGQRISGTRETPIPLSAEVEALMRGIVEAVTCWDELVRDRAGLHVDTLAAGRSRDSVALTSACRTLAAHLDAFAGLPSCEVLRWDETAGPTTRPAGAHMERRADPQVGAWTVVDMTGAQGAIELMRLAGRARHLLGRTRLVHRLDVPCPTCGVKALTRQDGAGQVRCESCGRAEPEERYQRLVVVLAGEMGKAR